MNSASSNPNEELPTVTVQDLDQMWDALAEQLEQFYQAWETNSPPEIEKFVPESPAVFRRFALNELIKADLELRYENGIFTRSLADYLKQFPEIINQGRIESDLLFEEIELRKKYKLDFDIGDYQSILPAQFETVQRMLGADKTTRLKQLDSNALANFQTGSRIDDFELLMELGKGAFATVFLARQLSMQRLVALKISKDRGDEPKTLAQLDCKNIVRVFDVRDIPDPPCRLLYMKFVAGGSLHDVVQVIRHQSPTDRDGSAVLTVVDAKAEKTGQDVPLDSRTRQRILNMDWPEIVCWIGSEIAEGLAFAHSQNVLHRDLKPANILLTTEGLPQIADFNVSFCEEVEGSTADAFFGGSLAYMSPEQIEAFNPDHPRTPEQLTSASDLYSLGIMLWELMFGRRPFDDQFSDSDYPQLFNRLLDQRMEFVPANRIPTDQIRNGFPVQGIFDLMLVPSPDSRISDANALSGELALLSDRTARELLRPKESKWTKLFEKGLVPFIVLAVVGPSLFAAGFNYFYNKLSIIDRQSEKVQETFQIVQVVINWTAFPLGIGILIFLGWSLYRRLADLRQNLSSANSIEARQHVVQMPFYSIFVPISLWTICGLAYPVAMNLGGAPITWGDSFHFLTSLILCGLIAAVYPFFVIAYVAIRFWYPIAFRTSELVQQDLDLVNRLTSRIWFFMALGVLLPTFSMLLMVVTQKESDRILLAILAGSSFVALGIVFVTFQKLQRHLETVRLTLTKLLENRTNQSGA